MKKIITILSILLIPCLSIYVGYLIGDLTSKKPQLIEVAPVQMLPPEYGFRISLLESGHKVNVPVTGSFITVWREGEDLLIETERPNPNKDTTQTLSNVYYSSSSSITPGYISNTGNGKNFWNLVETADSIGVQPSEKSDPLVIEEWIILFTDKTQPVEPEIFKSLLQHLVTTHNDTVSN